MQGALGGHALPADRPRPLTLTSKALVAILCVGAAAACLGGARLPAEPARIACGLLVVAGLATVTVWIRTVPGLRPFSALSLAFGTLAVVQLLNNTIPLFVRTAILHESASGGDPLASTVFGSLVLQLVEACIAIGPILLLTWLAGYGARDIYLQRGVAGRWLAISIAFFVLFYAFTVTIPLRPGSITERLLPTNGVLSVGRLIALTPALLVMAISNGFEEELLFRGLFLSRYEPLFGARLANLLQAAVFALAHAGVTYTPATFLFLLIAVFPLGLFFGYVMRTTHSILAPSIFHGAFDLAIYLVFLSYAA